MATKPKKRREWSAKTDWKGYIIPDTATETARQYVNCACCGIADCAYRVTRMATADDSRKRLDNLFLTAAGVCFRDSGLAQYQNPNLDAQGMMELRRKRACWYRRAWLDAFKGKYGTLGSVDPVFGDYESIEEALADRFGPGQRRDRELAMASVFLNMLGLWERNGSVDEWFLKELSSLAFGCADLLENPFEVSWEDGGLPTKP